MSERPKTIRCAIYTRKSTEHNLDVEFNSLHAQREACEAYIKSQMHEGWQLIRDSYDDGGISGGGSIFPVSGFRCQPTMWLAGGPVQFGIQLERSAIGCLGCRHQ